VTSAQEILTHYSLHSPSIAPGRYYTTCPQCSGSRTRAHQKLECLGITIDDKGVNFGRNHCGWTGGAYYASKLNGSGGNAAFVAVYDYVDRDGVLLFQVCRRADKQFPQRRPDGAGGWAWGTKRIKKVLFLLPELIESVQNNHTVLIPKGEKDVINLERIGYKATTSPGGASEPGKQPKWRKEYNEALRGADVVLLPDHDAAGYAHTQAIAESLDGVAKSIRILKLADHWAECPKGGDIFDWLKAGHTCEQLDDLIKNHANPWAAKEEVQKPTPHAAPTIEPTSLANVVKVFNKWLALQTKPRRCENERF